MIYDDAEITEPMKLTGGKESTIHYWLNTRRCGYIGISYPIEPGSTMRQQLGKKKKKKKKREKKGESYR
jgi:hypothetical protein